MNLAFVQDGFRAGLVRPFLTTPVYHSDAPYKYNCSFKAEIFSSDAYSTFCNTDNENCPSELLFIMSMLQQYQETISLTLSCHI
jgi:hypothetical protein